jgi:hypothetical protein
MIFNFIHEHPHHSFPKLNLQRTITTGGRLIEFQLIEIVFYHLIEIMLIT